MIEETRPFLYCIKREVWVEQSEEDSGGLMAISWVTVSVCYFRFFLLGGEEREREWVGVKGHMVSCPENTMWQHSFLPFFLQPLTSALTPEWKPAALLMERRDELENNDTTEEEWCEFGWLSVLFTQVDRWQRRREDYVLPFVQPVFPTQTLYPEIPPSNSGLNTDLVESGVKSTYINSRKSTFGEPIEHFMGFFLYFFF